MFGQVRRWRSIFDRSEFQLSPNLPDGDLVRLRNVVSDTITGRGGEVAARRRATEVGEAFLGLNDNGRRRFFEMLAQDFGPDEDEIDAAIADYQRSATTVERSKANYHLRETLRPSRIRLFRRFIGVEGGLGFLVDLREELLPLRRENDALAGLDTELQGLLGTWFDVGLLQLERITWQSPAALLEKLIDYEAVHAIESWDDLKGRLGEGRRCYDFMHPAMDGDPLIFVEVALTKGIADDLAPLLDLNGPRLPEDEADTAIFYSISNCHRGLAGVALGDFLIKRVVEQLSADLPNLTAFATLSPIPGFRTWLAATVSPPFPLDPERWNRILALTKTDHPTEPDADLKEPLLKLCAHYLVNERRRGRAADPVAQFHLSNGARIERINWAANTRTVGWERSLGLMVNYRYLPNDIETNHDRYVQTGEPPVSDAITKLLTS